MPSPDWYNHFFDDFRPAFAIVSPQATKAQVRFLIKALRLKPGEKFLDCPCGIGRIALPLAKAGIRVTGVDLTQSYIDELAETARKRRLKMVLQRRDMRRIDFCNRFDAAGNLWTSFGYFARESDNSLVLKKMFRALKPGGRFMLHLINRDWIMANFSPRDSFTIDDMEIRERRGFNYATSTSESVWTFVRKGRRVAQHRTTIRMYSFHELIGMLTKVGFVDINGYGSTRGAPISHKSQMMFITAVKPRG